MNPIVRIVPPLLLLFFSHLVCAAEPLVVRGISYAEAKHEQQTLDVYRPRSTMGRRIS
jgi:hypothetical protein